MKQAIKKAVKKFVDALPRYWKTVVVVIGVVTALAPDLIQGIQELFADGQWSSQDSWRLIILAATSYGVYKKRNKRPVGEVPDPTISEADIDPDDGVPYGQSTDRPAGW